MNRQEWQAHVNACNQKRVSKKAYVRQHNLNYSQFIYWYQKLTISDKKEASDFVAMKIKPASGSIWAISSGQAKPDINS